MSATFNLVRWLTNRVGYQRITASKTVTVLTEASLYFQTLNCAVAGGISSRATQHFPPYNVSAEKLYMQSKNSHINQVPHPFAWPLRPSLIARAAKKVSLHEIVLVGPGDDGSFQYGNNPNAVSQLLKDARSDTIINNVIGESKILNN
jgi:hypothetical protein